MPLTDKQKFDALDLMGGDMNDRRIAEKIGVGVQAIARLRRKHGIAAIPFTAPKFEPSPDQLAELEGCSNREMQRRHGVIASTWGKVRKRHDIPNYRPATTIKGKPQKWVFKAERTKAPPSHFVTFRESIIPPRDTSLAGEAASYLRRERFMVFNRAAIGAGNGWQVGPSIYDEAGLIAKAERLGFQREGWMG